MKETSNKEALITIVGFLGAGKTTLLKHLITSYIDLGWNPYIILNDYENAYLDSQQFIDQLDKRLVQPLSGSCICCSGIHVLRDFINNVPPRDNGITLIEANGTTDACSLSGFLGVGLNERYLPPVQISVVDVKNWQNRGEHNELEANQIQLSSLIVLTHTDGLSKEKIEAVTNDIKKVNPLAKTILMEQLDVQSLPGLTPSENEASKMDHHKAHWASCSADLPELPNTESINYLCQQLPKSILRVKGCTKLAGEESYTYFERTPDGEIHIKPFNNVPTVGAKLLTIGLGSEELVLKQSIENTVQQYSI